MDKKTLQRIESLIWILIFGGLLAVTLGLFLRLGGAADGHLPGLVLIVAGGIAAAGGALLILLRARWP